MREAQLKDVKATLSAVVDKAIEGEPTVITRRGKKEAVVLSFRDFEQLARVPSLGELLALFPVEAEDLAPRRGKPWRPADL